MPKTSFLLLSFVLSAAIASAQMGAVSHKPEPNFENAVAWEPSDLFSTAHTRSPELASRKGKAQGQAGYAFARQSLRRRPRRCEYSSGKRDKETCK